MSAMIKRSLFTFGVFLYFLAGMIVSCNNDDDGPAQPGNLTITADNSAPSAPRGESVEMQLNIIAENGIKSLTVTVDGGNAEALTVPVGTNEGTVFYTFEIPADALLDTQYNLEFLATDQEARTSKLNLAVTVAPLISEVPAAYNFTRNGQTTVSYSGQTDRLNMVAEMKSRVLAEGDKGNLISEQVLLDAFENTGENGGGLFSFTSDRQLKNKTFQPDLDDKLFENLFSEAAQASLAANQGTIASDGTAGLLTREDKGSTILVDENGREFTQLIEKGLMGAVFYNQIFNVYLSEARIGDDVENTELAEGKNYTSMEHHWDEAFGYWNPPLDFTSPWPNERRNELRFWSNYSNVVDNVDGNGNLGTNKVIMDAFLAGRTAIVNNDPQTKNQQRDILYEQLDMVAAATTVHYINSTLKNLNAGKTGEAFHTLSEAWAFAYALKYNPNRKLELSQIEEMKETDFGADGNFWNVTTEGLNKAKATLVAAYPKLAPVQDVL